MTSPQGDSIEMTLPSGEPGIVHAIGKEESAAALRDALVNEINSEPKSLLGGDMDNQNERGSPMNRNLGWDTNNRQNYPSSGNPSNQHAWLLVRRFNKQVFCVKSVNECPQNGLDMNLAIVDDVSPERILARFERLYMTIFIALYSFNEQIIRLRSWQEKSKTLLFFSIYMLAWYIELLTLTFIVFLIFLIIYPPARIACFLKAPPSIIDARTGVIRNPLAGETASDSVTGVPETQAGEAIEQEAHHFLKNIGLLIMDISSGKHAQDDTHEKDWDVAPDPSKLMQGVTEARDKINSVKKSENEDHMQRVVSHAIQDFNIMSTMDVLSRFIDNWERLANALSPSRPFPIHRPRIIVSAYLLPLLLIFTLTTWNSIMKGMGFTLGIYLFGRPILCVIPGFLDRIYPSWRESIELRNWLVRGVPTNAQLAVTFLRIAEKNHEPFPPPPDMYRPASDNNKTGQDSDNLHKDTSSDNNIQTGTYSNEYQGSESDTNDKYQGKSKAIRRAADAIKRVTKGSVQTLLRIDQIKAFAGNETSKERLGAIETPGKQENAGPIRFPARYHGKKGYAYVTTMATTPAISWRPETEDLQSAWIVSLSEIAMLQKVGGLGWKSEVVVGAVLGKEVADGMVLTTREGVEFHLTAVTLRDALFNRLISVGSHMWDIS